jgi:hypothetical protein
MTNTNDDEFGAPIRVSEETVVQRIAPLVKERAKLSSDLEVAEAEVKKLTESIRAIDEQQLPAMLDELGVDHIGVPLGDGRRLEIEVYDSIHASLPVKDPEKRRRGLAWLRANDHGSVITRAFGIEFKSSAKEREAAAKFEAYLKAYDGKIAVKDNDSVHHGTLTSLVKELLAEGKAPPDVLEVLGAHVTRKAKIS